MIHTAERLSFLGVPEPEHLIPEEQVGMIGTFTDHVHPKLLDEESLGLGPIAHANVDVIEPEETEFSGRRTARHGRPTTVPRYIRSVRPWLPP